MRKVAGSEEGDSSPFCNEVIMNLVLHGKLSRDVGIKITQEKYELSGLSINYLCNLIYEGKISSAKVLSMTREHYYNSALSYPYIQILVERDMMSSHRAFSISREEVENPLSFLTQLGSKRTLEQARKLQLYECEPNITADYVERIIMLEFKKSERHPFEEKELALLLDPALRKYATRIVELMFFSNNTIKAQRELSLLLDPYARCYADSIVYLEFKENKSVDDDINLETLYLRVCCQLQKKSVFLRLFQAALDSGGIELQQGCHFQGSLSGIGLVQSDFSESRQIQQMKAAIEKAAKDIVLVQLDVRGVAVKLREMESMQKYMMAKTDLLRHVLMKYFVGFMQPAYSKLALDIVKDKVCQKIRDKVLVLSDVDRILSLPLWIDKEEQSCERLLALH